MEKIEFFEGVVSEYNGEYWGIQHTDGRHTSSDFGPIENATISNPEFCKKPTDMTWNPDNTLGYNPEYNKLKNAKLVKIKKTITTKTDVVFF